MESESSFYLKAVFGEHAPGLCEAEIAKRSQRRFVRGNDQIAVYEPDRNPTGHVMTAWEAYDAFGLATLVEAMEYGTGVILSRRGAIESSLRNRREELGLTLESVAGATGLSGDEIRRAEEDSHQLSIQSLERIAFVLGLDNNRLAYHPTAGADEELAVRLKTLTGPSVLDAPRLSERTVRLFAESASIIRVQSQMQADLGIVPKHMEFEPSSNYGGWDNPAWRVGYRLAEQAREHLGLGDGPISPMRSLVEEVLGIPVIQARLQKEIAGATVAVRDEHGTERRGIVLNTDGQNRNVWVRRATLAHEIGHLLYDSEEDLKQVRVDTYDANSTNPEDGTDYVEQRANAFAIAFLAPLHAVRSTAPAPVSGDDVSKVMQHFGISLTSARFHISNAHYRQYDMPPDIPHTPPGDDWKGGEEFTADYFPIESTPTQRRGRFAGLVVAGYKRGLLSEQTAAAYLGCEVEDFEDNLKDITNIYPMPVQ